MRCDRVWTNARLLTLSEQAPGLGVAEDGVIAALGERIVYAGPAADAPTFEAGETLDCEGRWITPGLIDCHTHIVHGGDRAHEFEARLAGATYAEIARGGGGIAYTVAQTRARTEAELVDEALPRLEALMSEGVTTVEVKSGYGLTTDEELKMLRAARALEDKAPCSIVTTFLGAHATPPEFKGDPDAYIDLVCREMIPAVAKSGLATSVDAFCEDIAFSPAQTRRVFEAARNHGLRVKLHADQLTDQGGGALAAEFGALSADHIEFLNAPGIEAMARAGTVAVLLPGAFYFVGSPRPPPVSVLRAAGVPMAIATDCNPGSSPLTSMLLAMSMAATFFGLTIDECLAGATREGARALGILHQTGTLEAGKRCDLAIWNVERPAELVYRIGFNPLHARVWRGR
jgi:imidazolonepropionase